MSPSQIPICVLYLQLRLKLQIKLQCKLQTCLKMLKIASYERKKLVEVEPLTFISILTI